MCWPVSCSCVQGGSSWVYHGRTQLPAGRCHLFRNPVWERTNRCLQKGLRNGLPGNEAGISCSFPRASWPELRANCWDITAKQLGMVMKPPYCGDAWQAVESVCSWNWTKVPSVKDAGSSSVSSARCTGDNNPSSLKAWLQGALMCHGLDFCSMSRRMRQYLERTWSFIDKAPLLEVAERCIYLPTDKGLGLG